MAKLCSGSMIVERTEKVLCGESAVGSPAYAEVLARNGRRSAGLGGVPGSDSASGVPFVHHVWEWSRIPRPRGLVLAGATHQSLADLCCLAHRASEAVGSRSTVLAHPELWHGLGPAGLNGGEGRAFLTGDAPQPAASTEAPQDSLPEILRIFREFEEATGRSCGAVLSLGSNQAPVKLLTAGAYSGQASALVASRTNIVQHLALTLVHPFPLEVLAGQVRKGDRLVLLKPEDSPIHAEIELILREALRSRKFEGRQLEVLPLPAERVSSDEILGALAGLGLSGFEARGPTTAPALSLGMTPSSDWAEEVLLALGADVSQRFSVPPRLELVRGSSQMSLESGRDAGPGGGLDLLIWWSGGAGWPNLNLRTLRRNGLLLVASWQGEPTGGWANLGSEDRRRILASDVRLWEIDLEGCDSASAALAMREAAMQVLDSEGCLPNPQSTSPGTRVRQLDPETLDASLDLAETASEIPRLPQAVEPESSDSAWKEKLHRFHVSDFKAGRMAKGLDLPVLPAALAPCLDRIDPGESSSIFLPDSPGDSPQPTGALLDKMLMAAENPEILTRLRNQVVDLIQDRQPVDEKVDSVLASTLAELADQVDLSESGRRRIEEEIASLLKVLPVAGRVVRTGPAAWLPLLFWSLDSETLVLRKRFLEETQHLVNSLEALLLVDRSLEPEARSATRLSSSMGSGALGFIDTSRLSQVFPSRKGSMGLSPERRERIRSVLERLRRFLEDSEPAPAAHLVHDGNLQGAGSRGTITIHARPLEAALALFECSSSEMLEVLRAMRIGRLEAEGNFLPEVHGPVIQRLAWDSCEPEELLLIPPVVAFVTADQLYSSDLPDFYRVMQSGRPIRIVISVSESIPASEEVERLSGVLTDPGFLAMAEREVYVLRSSVAKPSHLLTGLRRMLHVPGPAVAVLAYPMDGSDQRTAWQRWLVAWLSRTAPTYSYDPWLGDSWADRFSVDGNEDPALPAPAIEIPYREGSGERKTMREELTFAHVAALDFRLRRHFSLIPPEAWSADQYPLAEYLEKLDQLSAQSVPFIWVVDPVGYLQRAVVSIEVVNASRDRRRAWRMLQELAGLRNTHVERAVSETRRELAEAFNEELERVREEARKAGASEAVDRLIGVLLKPGSVQLPPLDTTPVLEAYPAASKVTIPVVPEAEQLESVEAPVEAALEEGLESDEPYIDSFLCTSCNDCTNLNPRMFKYNHDRQAFIADPAAGTYKELVKAAESCPARCIHPGAPLPGDQTATPEILERAKPFR